MVKSFIYLFFLVPMLLFSVDFSASLNKKNVRTGESVILTLTLKDTSAKGNPNLDPLEKLFTIHSQNQMNRSLFVNGKMSSSIAWKLTLFPLQEGELVIPPISIDTDKGLLETQPIILNVSEGSLENKEKLREITFIAEIDKKSIYKNEPHLLNFRLISKYDLRNLSHPQIKLEDAILELNGEPKIFRQIVNGEAVNIVEFSYILTPLKAGSLKIAPTSIQGSFLQQKEHHSYDLFSMIRGFDEVTPFVVSSNEISIEVLPAIADVKPWLPASDLKMEEKGEFSQNIKEGEPLSRSITIQGVGIKSSQLPSLEKLQIGDLPFKVYTDKPKMEEEIKNGRIYSSRVEQFTLIPQQAGHWVLPEISVAWWDVENHVKKMAVIPSRSITVLPAPEKHMQREKSLGKPETIIQNNPLLFALIGLQFFLIVVLTIWALTLQKRLTILNGQHSHHKKNRVLKVRKSTKDKNEKLPDLNPT